MKLNANAAAISAVLERSDAFEETILACFPKSGVVLAVTSVKHELVAAACTLCVEHARVLRAAFVVNAPSSGSAVLRLQYESLLRSAWLMFAATEAHVEKLATPA